MNEHMRRYLDEDWDDVIEPSRPSKHEQKPAKNPVVASRDQQRKEWGRSIAKFQRQKSKQEGGNRKP